MKEEKFIVRLYDGFDNEWMDITKSLSREEAQKIWDKETLGGTKNTCFEDIDYYKIFPANTRMFFSSKEGRQNE